MLPDLRQLSRAKKGEGSSRVSPAGRTAERKQSVCAERMRPDNNRKPDYDAGCLDSGEVEDVCLHAPSKFV